MEEESSRMKAMGVSKADVVNPLDPLLEVLARFKNPVRTNLVAGMNFEGWRLLIPFTGRAWQTD
jgi:hypothetical protein